MELIGPEEDVRAPEGMAPLAAAPAEPAGRGVLEAGVPPPRLGELAARLEDAGPRLRGRAWGSATCLIAVESADDVAPGPRAGRSTLGGHAQVVDGPDDLRADPWGPPPPGLELMRRLRDAFDPAGILNRGMLLWERASRSDASAAAGAGSARSPAGIRPGSPRRRTTSSSASRAASACPTARPSA